MPGADIRTVVLGRRKSEGWWPEALLMITLSLLYLEGSSRLFSPFISRKPSVLRNVFSSQGALTQQPRVVCSRWDQLECFWNLSRKLWGREEMGRGEASEARVGPHRSMGM